MGYPRVFAYILIYCFVFLGTLGALAIVGKETPDFVMQDVAGGECQLSKFRGKVVVLEWINPNCPYVLKQYSKDTNGGIGNMQMMQRQFTQPSVGVVWISMASSSPGTKGYLNSQEWGVQLQKWGARPTSLIIDESGEIARLFGATRTPEVFVIGKDGTLLYRGAVDSLRGTDPSEIERTSNLHWLKRAVENVIRDKRVIPPETIPYGCSIR